MLKKLEGPLIGSVFGIFVFLIINIAMGRDILSSEGRTFEPITPPVIDLDPESLYSTNCAACHQADGQGMPGQFPALAGSDWVTTDAETPIRIVLKGLQGEITVDGVSYNAAMPAQSLNDEQIGLVLTYVRSNFGNDAPEITTGEVAAVRAAHSDRDTPWNGGAELIELRDAAE